MKVSLYEHFKQLIYDLVSRNSSLKSISKRLYSYLVEKRSVKGRNLVFKNNAIEVLKEFTDCLDQNQVEYTLAFGSLLGAIREKGFIKHDLDIDVTIWYENNELFIKSCLNNSGFRMIHSFSVDNGASALEETYEKNGVTIDIFYLYDAVNQLPYCCDFVKFPDSVDWTMSLFKHGGLLPRRIELPWTKERIRTVFETLYLYIPQNAQELLEKRYGPDYMTPNPNWVNSLEHPFIVNWTEKIGHYESV